MVAKHMMECNPRDKRRRKGRAKRQEGTECWRKPDKRESLGGSSCSSSCWPVYLQKDTGDTAHKSEELTLKVDITVDALNWPPWFEYLKR